MQKIQWKDALVDRPECNRTVLFVDYDRTKKDIRVGWFSTAHGFMSAGLEKANSPNARYYVYEDEIELPDESILPDFHEWNNIPARE